MVDSCDHARESVVNELQFTEVDFEYAIKHQVAAVERSTECSASYGLGIIFSHVAESCDIDCGSKTSGRCC